MCVLCIYYAKADKQILPRRGYTQSFYRFQGNAFTDFLVIKLLVSVHSKVESNHAHANVSLNRKKNYVQDLPFLFKLIIVNRTQTSRVIVFLLLISVYSI